MPLKKSTGNMYSWVDFTHSHLGGECPHKCVYCYVDNPRFGRPEKYKGKLRLIESEFDVKYRAGKTIFIENCNDLFAADVPQSFINKILVHCLKWPNNQYVFQTKNPVGYKTTLSNLFPDNCLFGTTIETNRSAAKISQAPEPIVRYEAMRELKARKFVTIEPIMDFDVDRLAIWIFNIEPEFVNIGSDSKGHNLPEPSIEKVRELISILQANKIEVREKHNLERLILK